jgi:hypothetical protein
MRPARLAALLLAPFTLAAQTSSAPAAHPRTNAPASDKAATLPVTRVSLYKNGVGFFEHTGHVSGNAEVRIDFNTAQLNDVLQSLTAVDLNGGRIAGAGYNSATPLDQQLKSLPLALSADTTAADFYAAIRGARVEVHAPGVVITGRLLSVEDRQTPVKDGDQNTTVDRHFLTVVSDSGEVRTVELTQATSVRLLDTALHNDVARYLQLLASNHAEGLRHLTLSDRGTAANRELRISYISEVPIWKSTYRFLLTGNTPKTGTLQGWAVVDNTVGEDWNNVQLSLIAGAPQSFIQPLSQPIYARRPEIPIAQEAQLTPQTFDSSINGAISSYKVESLPMDARTRGAGLSLYEQKSRAAGGSGLGPGSGGNTGAGVYAKLMAPPPAPTPIMSYQEAVSASTSINTTTAAFDDYFAYNLTEPVTIRKNESALVPILQAKVPVDRVTLASFNGYSVTQPLRALWLTNDTGLTLDRGSFAIVENGNFGGEGLLDPIHAGEKRLLSYAADQAVHVTVASDKTTNRVTLLHGSRGVVNIHRADLHDLELTIHNAASEQRTVVVELPVVSGWKLADDVKPFETTPTVYRFRLDVAAGEMTQLRVPATRGGYTTYYLSRSDDNQLQFILNESGHNAALEAKLQPVLEARRRVADAQTAVDQTNKQLKNLHEEEERQRANITALAASDKGAAARFVRDLNATEDQIQAAQKELTTRTAALDAAKAELAARIEAFSINEKL